MNDEQVLEDVSGTLNIPEGLKVSSPFKRRKLNNIHFKSYIPGKYSKIENLTRLKRSTDQKDVQVNELHTSIMTLETQKQNIELENFKLENDLISVKQQLRVIQDQMDELAHHETQSLREIDQKYELTIQELKLDHESRLEREKEAVSQQVEQLIGKVQQETLIKRDQISQECQELEQEIKLQTTHELPKALQQLDRDQKCRASEKNQSIDKEINDWETKLLQIDQTIQQHDNENNKLEQEKRILNDKTKELQALLESVTNKFKAKKNDIDSFNQQITNLETTIHQIKVSIESKQKQIQDENLEISNKKAILQYMEQERRYLHNKYQELKGNIRVYCRIRPCDAIDTHNMINIEYPTTHEINQSIVISKEHQDNTDYSQGHQRSKPLYNFEFDKVFQPHSKNQEIFEELSQLVQSSLDGYNVCVFAYGQTGSGKTWTMSHPQDGMIPLTINKIFNDINELKQSGWEYQVNGQFLEIYNDNIIDLLKSPSPNADIKYEIKHDDINGRTTVINLSSIKLESPQEAMALFRKSAQKRSTASTKSNERSSRSHSIFILKLSGSNSKTGTKCEGHLNLVDLAGSERLNNSQVKGDRLKETQHINKSLACLGDVIYSLAHASKNATTHIPYRNCKLTYLLKHSLGGNSKTLMFVNISPALANFNESLNSFRFASKVSNIKQPRS